MANARHERHEEPEAVLMVNEEANDKAITRFTGYNREHAFWLRKRYAQQGVSGIEDKRKKNPKELLTKREREEILQTIKTKTPNECDTYYGSDYWTTPLVGEYIRRTYHVAYKSKTSIYLIFRQAKFTYHKPSRVYERRNEQEVQEWRNEAKKQAQDVWEDKDTIILTEDEMHLSTQTTVQKIWLP